MARNAPVSSVIMRGSIVVLASLVAAVPAPVAAQEWSLQVGGAGRVEYTDNYFFVPTDTQSAFTTSITPFVTAFRRTETSEIAALLGVGANLVSGSVPTEDYWSGRFELRGLQRGERSVWSGQFSITRSPSLQNEITPSGIILSRAYTDNATVSGGYRYTLSDSWSIGATAMAYANQYDAVQADDAFQSNNGYAVGGTADYRYSDRTRVVFAAVFSHFSSDIDRNDSVTATVGIAHEISPQLTISASAGGYWFNPDPSSVSTGNRETGALFGGSVVYDIAERTRLIVNLSQTLSPSGTGLFSKDDNATVSLTNGFSDRLTIRVGAGYTRTKFPSAIGGSVDSKYYVGELGASYRFTERWTLDAGYRYARARYSQDAGEPRSNIAFLNVSYNWPGASVTDWIGSRADSQSLPGAAPISLPDRGVPAPERSPFDQYWIP
jgi:Putative beta-barrel porin 2